MKKKYNQRALARDLKEHHVRFNGIVNGRVTPGRIAATRYAKTTGIPLETWLCGTTLQKQKAVREYIAKVNKQNAGAN